NEVSTLRYMIKNHMIIAHTLFTCDIDGCGKTFKHICNLQVHQRIHLGIKPYQCKWTNCGYASTSQSNALQHIRMQHFKISKHLKEQAAKGIVDDRDARKYLHVDTELLEQSEACSK